MFHTFQSSVGLRSPGAEGDGPGGKPARAAGSRRISTSNACVECRRRKIRCDGTQPCGQCQWYQHPEACGYSKPAQRVVPSRKLVDKLSNNIEQYKTILAKLYPSKELDTLASLPREELLELALSSPPPPALTTSPSTAGTQSMSEATHGSDGADGLEALEQAPPEDPYWDEARKHLVRVQGISDDVNGLSMSVDRLSSYVGISSITAALKVIVRCAPQARPLIAHNNQETALPSRAGSPTPDFEDERLYALPPQAHGHELIESYFERVHPFFPMIEERKFWSMFLYGDRRDSPWLALLNMVFALGSLASSTADNEAHYVYYNRSRHHLTLESFGSGSLEVLQALAIMSGYYMHYLNRPNEAHSLMGGTLRMATALGLHREYSDASKIDMNRQLHVMAPGEEDSISPEMRRRIWWSLFCLDAWASTTTGRPSLGRMGPSITVLPPGTVSNSADGFSPPNSSQYIEQLKVLPLMHSSEFCKIATRIQDRLVESTLLTPSEMSAYDAEVIRWQEELPSILSNMNESCPDFLRRVRFVMKWRFQNIRIVLHRPVLLNTALRRCPFSALSAEEKVAVGKCRIIAAKTIEDIASECLPDLISGWNAVWFTFQACMVPLVSLFSDTSLPEEIEKWCASIETALNFFERSKPWSIAAKRSMDAVSKLYRAYKLQFPEQQQQQQYHQHHPPQPQPQSHPHPQSHRLPHSHPHPHAQYPPTPFEYTPTPDIATLSMNPNAGAWTGDPHAAAAASMGHLSGFWDDMMWDTNLPDMLETPFNITNEYGFQGAGQDSGAPCWMQGN
ncbi:fungal-specific transcription factor domain-containing protein [Massariosphaeria phaeospora]|uniref:Fungal-specific transcription factor domain-containing protein n=1 Tax=Massariosphaeria phaeospora TaxID=100035 RepID=A0A7C8MPR1_9PLEO|nr:fungal-specific transcription factor domain-containing protein [Massariosphaeria phaeospora]